MKLEFAKGNLVDIIQEQVAKFSDHEIAQGSQPDDEFDIERVASDIIILLLTGGNGLFVSVCRNDILVKGTRQNTNK